MRKDCFSKDSQFIYGTTTISALYRTGSSRIQVSYDMYITAYSPLQRGK